MATIDTDLSPFTSPIGRLFPGAGPVPRLDSRDLDLFARDGFLPGPTVLDPEQLEAVRAAVDELLAGASPAAARLPVLRQDRRGDEPGQVHAVGAWRVHEVLHDLVFHPAVAAPVGQLLGHPRPRLFRDQIFLKEAGSAGVVPWHQDYSDWTHVTPPALLTCWIALDDADEDNGCLYYLPGSHHGPLLPKIRAREEMADAFERLAPAQQQVRPQPVPVRAGACVFHHCLTVHGSYGNRSAAPRRAVALAFQHPEVRSASAERPAVPGGPVVPVGEVLAGPPFPEVGGDLEGVR